jgi:hypothetical protein
MNVFGEKKMAVLNAHLAADLQSTGCDSNGYSDKGPYTNLHAPMQTLACNVHEMLMRCILS